MLNALEEDPDEKHRWRRFGGGALVAIGVTSVLLYAAQNYAPTRDLMQRVVMTIHTPPPEANEPLPPLPPPPPPKPRPKAKEQEKAEKKPVQKPDPNVANADPSQVGMDAQSFAEGGGGPAFRAGGNQMGDPNVVVPAAMPKPEPVAAVKRTTVPVKYSMARPTRTGAGLESLFSARARKLGLSGLMIVELDLDGHGRVRSAKLRRGLEPQFDREVLAAVKQWEFEAPGTSGFGYAVASVRMLRLRFTLKE